MKTKKQKKSEQIKKRTKYLIQFVLLPVTQIVYQK